MTTSSPVALLNGPIPPEPELSARKSVPIRIASTSTHPVDPAIGGQPQYYFIPSSRPLWQNPLNDF
jgi:hypothetical protein